MLYYAIEAVLPLEPRGEDRADQREWSENVAAVTDEFCSAHDDALVFVARRRNKRRVTLGAAVKTGEKLDELLKEFMEAVELEPETILIKETTIDNFSSLVSAGYRTNMISDDDLYLDYARLGPLNSLRMRLTEQLIDAELPTEEAEEKPTGLYKEADILAEAEMHFLKEALEDEIHRIYQGAVEANAVGHPVEYILCSDSAQNTKRIEKLLLRSLYVNRRLRARRFLLFRPDFCGGPDTRVNALYDMYDGGTIILNLREVAGMEPQEYSDGGEEGLRELMEQVRRHRNNVLTILLLPRSCEKFKLLLREQIGDIPMVEIQEPMLMGDSARRYLACLAEEAGISHDNGMDVLIKDENAGYLQDELREMFDKWYNDRLRTAIYPQYKDFRSERRKLAECKPIGSAYDMLMAMPGLTEAKKVIDQALGYYKMQKLFANRGVAQEHPAMTMAFMGPSGTAKTSTARLFARILKENGLLSRGTMHEVSRADIVSRYVGGTSPLVQKHFRQAKGGILFLDECYSLTQEREGLYGTECLNEICYQLENNREDLCVIFAGYEAETMEFLAKNPGLSSRVNFKVRFDDYSTSELMEISDMLAAEKKLRFSADAKEKLRHILDEARRVPAFGNGRYCRNLLEKAAMNQAGRLLKMDYEQVTDEQLFTITAEDLEFPAFTGTTASARIGFV